MPTCSVVVCTRHRVQELKRCLDSFADTDDPSIETVVVDNSTGDRATEQLVAAAGARYVLEPCTGLSRARNTGARAAKGELIGFIDDDAVAEPGWLRAHSTALADPGLAATTGRILPLASARGEAAPELSPHFLDLGDSSFTVNRSTPSWFEIANFGGLGFGGNMVFRRSLFENGFTFRESLGAGVRLSWGEEFYAFFSLVKAGHGIAYVPEAVVRHEPAVKTLGGAAKARRAGAAYLTMLLVEEPDFRRATSRYTVDVLRRRRPRWRRADSQDDQANRLQMMKAAVGGPLLYVRSRSERR